MAKIAKNFKKLRKNKKNYPVFRKNQNRPADLIDSLGRVLDSIAKPDTGDSGTWHTTTYAYDRLSHLTTVNNNGNVTSYTYDDMDRIKEVNDIENRLVKYEYDELGRRTKLTYPDGNYVTYQYNSLSKLTKITDQDSTVLAEYSYDGLSRRTLLTLGNDANAVYDYNDLSRLTDLNHNLNNAASTTITYDYTYDVAGNRSTMTVDGSDQHSYTYDDLSRLTYVNYPGSDATSYDYNSIGNRTQVDDGSITSYTSNYLNQYTQVGVTNYTYDLSGNLTNDGTYEYYYDCENRLTDVNENNQSVGTYSYDFKARRISKVVDSNTTKYCYDGDQAVAEYDGSGNLLRKFVYGPGIDEPICMIDVNGGNLTYYYHFDGLGSVIALSNADANIVETYSYDVFGEPNRTSDVNNPYMFTARRYDSESSLYYYRARYYSHKIGRFLQVDPIGYKDGLNLYTYVHNNPVNRTDPLGLTTACVGPTCGGDGGSGNSDAKVCCKIEEKHTIWAPPPISMPITKIKYRQETISNPKNLAPMKACRCHYKGRKFTIYEAHEDECCWCKVSVKKSPTMLHFKLVVECDKGESWVADFHPSPTNPKWIAVLIDTFGGSIGWVGWESSSDGTIIPLWGCRTSCKTASSFKEELANLPPERFSLLLNDCLGWASSKANQLCGRRL